VFAGADRRGHWRPLEPAGAARVLPSYPPLRGVSVAPSITRHLLADRLKKFVKFVVLRRVKYQERPARCEYILTQRGLDPYPIVMAIVHWGDTHMVDELDKRPGKSTTHPGPGAPEPAAAAG